MAGKNHLARASAPFPGAAASNDWPAWGSKTLDPCPTQNRSKGLSQLLSWVAEALGLPDKINTDAQLTFSFR